MQQYLRTYLYNYMERKTNGLVESHRKNSLYIIPLPLDYETNCIERTSVRRNLIVVFVEVLNGNKGL